MSATPEALSRTWFTKVWNEVSEAAIHEMLAADAKVHGLPTPGGKPLVGPRGLRAVLAQVSRRVSRHADHRGARGRARRHGGGALPGRRASHGRCARDRRNQQAGRDVGMGIARVKDGKIVETWNSFDFMTLYQQIGLLPALG